MDKKTLNKVLTEALTKQDARFEARLTKTLSKGLTRLEKRIDARMDARFEKQDGLLKIALSDQSRDMRDFTRQEIVASENRIMKRMDKRFDGQKQEIIDAMAESMDYFVYPRINDHEQRLLKLEARAA